MLKKLHLVIVALLLSSAISAQMTWMGFSKSEPAAPEVNVLTSNTQSVIFEVSIPGIYTMDTIVNGVAFTRLNLPNGIIVNPAGHPEIPVLKYRFAIPNCTAAEIEYQIVSRQTMTPCLVYPVPNIVAGPNFEGIEEFAFDSVAYTQPHVSGQTAIAVSSGSLREQNYIEVMVQAVEYDPVSGQLSVTDKVEVTLTFINPQGALQQNVGIFNKVATKAFINYNDTGISASYNDQAFKRGNFTPGNVQFITLTDTAQAKNIVADYLIICADQFITKTRPPTPHPQIIRLAEHRAFYNGFDVAIVNVENILSLPFFFEDITVPPKFRDEQKMRTFIRRVYEGAHANHPGGDGHLAYVALIGDCYAGNTGMPTATEHGVSVSTESPYHSDYYFSCIKRDAAGNYGELGSLFVGRLSVEDGTQLFNMVEKTIRHEKEFSFTPWRKTAGTTFPFKMEIGPNPGRMKYLNFINNLFTSCGWNYSIVDGFVLNNATKIPTMSYLNAGASFVQYIGMTVVPVGDPCSWDDGLNKSYFLNNLNNDYKAPFINSLCTNTGQFVNTECLGEFITRYDSVKGAVGYIGPSNYVHFLISSHSTYQELLPSLLVNDSVSIAGELQLTNKILDDDGYAFEIQRRRYAYNLFGDPALNIFAVGYEITSCPIEISTHVRIPKETRLIVPDSCILTFLQEGKLTIEREANLIIGNHVQVIGDLCETDSSLHVKGGGLTLGNNVTFQNLSGGVLLENGPKGYQFYNYEDGIQYNLRGATFNNTPLTHSGCRLNVSNCTFNMGSNVKTYSSKSVIDSCIFNETTFMSDQTALPTTVTPVVTTVGNSYFYGPGYPVKNYTNFAISLKNASSFNIYNNTITDYLFGINLDASGETNGIGPSTIITNNDISYCYWAIRLYNSVASFTINNIYENDWGIGLYNNCYTVFDNYLQPYQIIRDCGGSEFYISANSFPTIFRYNQIIDEDNISPPHPLIGYDVLPGSHITPKDVKYNCWGVNFDPVEDLFPYQAFEWDPVWACPGKHDAPTIGADEMIYQAGLSYFAEEDYINAKSSFMDIVENYPQSIFSIAALHELFALEHYTNGDFAALHDYYATFTPADSALFDVADFLATRCNVVIQNWQPAIDWYEERIENPPSYQDSVFAVIDLGDIHLMMENDSLKSARVFRFPNIKPESRQQYEENKSALLATLPKLDQPRPQHPLAGTGKKGVLNQNIPNPAKESTTIVYDVIEEGSVHLRIYNQLGQLLQDLPQGTQKPGSYRLEVSLVGMPAGVYHYVLFVEGEKADGKKLIVN